MIIEQVPNPPALEQLIERCAARPLSFILDSSQSNDGMGEWSFFGAEPFQVFRSDAQHGGGLAQLRQLMANFQPAINDSGIPFVGGAVGFVAYEYGRKLEQIAPTSVDDRKIPDLHFGLYDGIAAYHHASGELHLVALGLRADAATVMQQLRTWVTTEVAGVAVPADAFGVWEWNMTQAEFEAKVAAVREFIASGDVYQVNLSQRARCCYNGSAVPLFQALRQGNPAPYSAYLDTGELQLISTSPEQFLRKRGRLVETRPIKGTRPRGRDAAEDTLNAQHLRESEKDRAELLMIVDLERNDLGRVAEFGTVAVEGLFKQERYARVMHQSAQVKARLAEGQDVYDCIRALFPGGSITGAPKVRAMELIESLEPTCRGVYCGCIGYIGFDGNAELNIAIRSLHLKDGYLDYQVGSGIVWDSEPAAEYVETQDKGRAIRETIDAL